VKRITEISNISDGSSNDYVEVQTPGRICLLGDKIDLAELPVIGCAVNCLSTIKIRKIPDSTVRIFTNTYQSGLEYKLGEKGDFNHLLKYWCAIIYRLGDRIEGFEAILSSDIPVGSGLSSSAAISVGLISALNKLFELGMNNYEIAELAYITEHDDLGIMCGRLDQYSITFGGVSFIHTNSPPKVTHVPIQSLPIVLADSGDSRKAQDVLIRIKNKLKAGDAQVHESFHKIHQAVIECHQALQQNDYNKIGALMNLQQIQEKKMETTTPKIDLLCRTALEHGALGAKQIGAGGGGCMIALCPEHSEEVSKELQRIGGKVYKFNIYNY